MNPFIEALAPLTTRRVVLLGGKGGVGKTTLSAAAALHFAESRPTILFTTDPASNLGDLLRQPQAGTHHLTIESLDAAALYERFLSEHLESFLEIADRGTYLDRDEIRRLFELSVPGIDELMAWMHIGELAEQWPESMLVVDTAPTGHTLRMLGSGDHFARLGDAFDAMQEKHRAIVRQFARRDVRDAVDNFIEDFEARATRRSELLSDAARAAFIPVTLSEPLVVQQTLHLISEVAIDVPFVVLNRAHDECRSNEDSEARERFARADGRSLLVVDAPRACFPLDDLEPLGAWMRGELVQPPGSSSAREPRSVNLQRLPRLVFFAGKGGVGKTSCATSVALRLAANDPNSRFVVISVDPAHSLLDLFEGRSPPSNLKVEAIDTKAKWRRFRESLGDQVEKAVAALTPKGMSLEHDSESMRHLIEIAPPGADELFAITRLADLVSDETVAAIVVDTAPTGHFLRLLDLPPVAGEWVREFMRLLLRYRELLPAGNLGEELVRASKALRQIDGAIHSESAGVVIVTRPERIVIAESKRLKAQLQERKITVSGVIANYVTPAGDCPCDRSMRAHELAELEDLGEATVIERKERPPLELEELATLVPIELTPS